VVTCIRQWKAKLVAVGFQEMVFEDAMEIVIDQLNSLGTAESLSVAQLEHNFCEPMLSPMIIMLLRMLTSAEIQRRSDFFAPFIMVRSACILPQLQGSLSCRATPGLESRRRVLCSPLVPTELRSNDCNACALLESANKELVYQSQTHKQTCPRLRQ
jgi:hypothetical protein